MSNKMPVDRLDHHHWNLMLDIENTLVNLADQYETTDLDGPFFDLEAAGLIAISPSAEGLFRIVFTNSGWKTVGEIRRNAADGKRNREFVPSTARAISVDEKKRALSWIAAGDQGPSSVIIWAVMMGLVDEDECNVFSPTIAGGGTVPAGEVEFGKCVRLLELIPEWRQRLDDLARISPEWGPIIASWDILSGIYNKRRGMISGINGKVLSIIKKKTRGRTGDVAAQAKNPALGLLENPRSGSDEDPATGVRIDLVSQRKCMMCGQRIGETASTVYQVTEHGFIHGYCLKATQSAGNI